MEIKVIRPTNMRRYLPLSYYVHVETIRLGQMRRLQKLASTRETRILLHANNTEMNESVTDIHFNSKKNYTRLPNA